MREHVELTDHNSETTIPIEPRSASSSVCSRRLTTVSEYTSCTDYPESYTESDHNDQSSVYSDCVSVQIEPADSALDRSSATMVFDGQQTTSTVLSTTNCRDTDAIGGSSRTSQATVTSSITSFLSLRTQFVNSFARDRTDRTSRAVSTLSQVTSSTVSTRERPKSDIAVVWEKLSVYKKTPKRIAIGRWLLYERHEKIILRNVSGYVKFGELTAIMGKSNASLAYAIGAAILRHHPPSSYCCAFLVNYKFTGVPLRTAS